MLLCTYLPCIRKWCAFKFTVDSTQYCMWMLSVNFFSPVELMQHRISELFSLSSSVLACSFEYHLPIEWSSCSHTPKFPLPPEITIITITSLHLSWWNITTNQHSLLPQRVKLMDISSSSLDCRIEGWMRSSFFLFDEIKINSNPSD